MEDHQKKMSFGRDEKVHFQSDQVAAIEEAFSCFDFNNDGLISQAEFKQILRSLGENATDKEISEKLKVLQFICTCS